LNAYIDTVRYVQPLTGGDAMVVVIGDPLAATAGWAA
jgi:diphthamide biosynthesis methyltransferase